jgi:hypothetical protein
MFQLGPSEPAEAAYVTNFFHCLGFRNSAQSPAELKHFLPADKLTVRLLHDDPDVLALSYEPTWGGLDADVLALLEFSTWRYVASVPTNNPGRFDLWIDIRVGGKKLVLGNWRAVE